MFSNLGTARALWHTAPSPKSSCYFLPSPILSLCSARNLRHSLTRRCHWVKAYLSIALSSEQTFTKYSHVSEAIAGARERKMNEIQPLPLRRSESSGGDLYGSEMIIYEALRGRSACIKRGMSPGLDHVTAWKQRSDFQMPAERAAAFRGALVSCEVLLSEGEDRGSLALETWSGSGVEEVQLTLGWAWGGVQYKRDWGQTIAGFTCGEVNRERWAHRGE